MSNNQQSPEHLEHLRQVDHHYRTLRAQNPILAARFQQAHQQDLEAAQSALYGAAKIAEPLARESLPNDLPTRRTGILEMLGVARRQGGLPGGE